MFVITAVMLHALEMCFQFLQLGTYTSKRKIKIDVNMIYQIHFFS